MKNFILYLCMAVLATAQVSIPWTDVDKTGASLADLPTRNFADLQNTASATASFAALRLGSSFGGTPSGAFWANNNSGNAWQRLLTGSMDGNVGVAAVLSTYHDSVANITKLGLGTIGYGGSEQTLVLQNGNVGIGTTSPTAKLDVAGDGSFSGTLRVGGTSTVTGLRTATGVTTAGAIAGGASATYSLTVSGVTQASRPSVTVTFTDVGGLPTGLIPQQAWVSVDNTVAVRLTNVTAAAIDPGLSNYRVTVTSF